MGERAEGIGAMSWLVKALMKRVVEIHVDGFKVIGCLLAVSESQRYPVHLLGVLILETVAGPCIIRDWTLIVFSGRL
jgi:hypothetical protein